ncbi:MAG: hypothetical protein OJF47_000968 [Nitrospira sp.]|jgi:hypothetical protein|nr:MAG: hypothetical protein OJF47_000968 [Nitrospira sp.]
MIDGGGERMPDHFTATVAKQGVFEKSKDYRKICKGCRHGYHDGMWQAHHVLPGVTLQGATIAKQVNEEKAKYIENCKWITKWDLNAKDNMMGLPTIWDYILAEKIKNTGSGGEVISTSKYRSARINVLVKRLTSKFSGPKNHPAHNPVSWGHVDFNCEVTDFLKTEIWDHLNEKKEEHKINPESIKGQLDDAAKHFMSTLEARGQRGEGTEKEWPRRFDAGNDTWYHPFSMAADPENPL